MALVSMRMLHQSTLHSEIKHNVFMHGTETGSAGNGGGGASRAGVELLHLEYESHGNAIISRYLEWSY